MTGGTSFELSVAVNALVVGRGTRGRGAWLCAGSPRCLEQAIRRGAFERALRKQVEPSAVEGLNATVNTKLIARKYREVMEGRVKP